MSNAIATELIPLFPLSNVVLFPHIHCPLHIFEARYQQMIAAALSGARRIGMVTVLPEHQTEMGGDPPLFSIGCIGTIEQSRRRDDGRYDIVLLGAERFRIVEEIPRDAERLYRLARVERVAERFDEAIKKLRPGGVAGSAREVAELIHRAVHDPQRKLRYLAGGDADTIAATYRSLAFEDYERTMRQALDWFD